MKNPNKKKLNENHPSVILPAIFFGIFGTLLTFFFLVGTPYSSVPPNTVNVEPVSSTHLPQPIPSAPENNFDEPSFDDHVDLLFKRLEKATTVKPREDCNYTVEPGDSLHVIAAKLKKQFNLAETHQEIIQGVKLYNEIEDVRRIKVGMDLMIPLSEFQKPHPVHAVDQKLLAGINYQELLHQCSFHTPNSIKFNSGPETLYYTVQDGDSLYNIGRKVKEEAGLAISLQGFVQEIAWLNDIEDPRNVYPGTELEIVLTNERTMAAMLSYDGFNRKSSAGKLHYTKEELMAFVDGALTKHKNVPEKIFKRMLAVESGGDHLAVSPVGAGGLMQLMPLTAKRLGLKIWNPKGYVFPEDIASKGARKLYQKYADELKEFARKEPYKLMEQDDRFLPQKNIYAAARLLSRSISTMGYRNAVAMYNGGKRGLTSGRALETKRYMSIVLN